MRQHIPAEFETQIQTIARGFPYPSTPDITAAVRQQVSAPARQVTLSRQLAGVALAVGLILAGLLAVPQVRAAVIEFLQLGSVRIFLTEPTPTSSVATNGSLAPATATPIPEASNSPLKNLAGETTLAAAQAQIDFPIRWPPEFGPPDKVYLQELGGAVLVLVWLDPLQPNQILYSLHQLTPGTFVSKIQPQVIQETTVNGRPALWTQGPYFFQLHNGSYDTRRLVEGNVLIWTEGDITYRLESNLSLDKAIAIAERLR